MMENDMNHNTEPRASSLEAFLFLTVAAVFVAATMLAFMVISAIV